MRQSFFILILLVASLIPSSSHAQDDSSSRHPNSNKQQLRRGLWRQSRIVGGQSATKGRFPYFVQLPNGCGGSLIAPDLVITAAHCVYGNQNDVTMRAMPTVYVGGVKTNKGQERSIVDFRIDPRYQPHTESYDFAILLLDKPVENVAPIQLNEDPMYPMNGTPLTVIGFGHTRFGADKGSATLQHAMVNYRADCSSASYRPGRVREYEMMCANDPDYSKDSCHGDSGGGLVDAENLLVGVVSWGEGCAKNNAPGVYARVSAASEWIGQQKCELSNFPPVNCVCTKFSPKCQEIRVDVHYDSYPAETGWKLIRQRDGKVFASSPVGSISGIPQAVISYPVLVPGGAYDIEVDDAYGDGMCCNYGSGFVTVFNGLLDIRHPGVFKEKTVRPFEVPVIRSPATRGGGNLVSTLKTPAPTPTPPPSPEPTAAPTPAPRVTLRVEILYDWYPKETSWSLVEDETNVTVHSSAASSVTTPMQAVATDVAGLLSGNSYTLTIMDLARDGLCCAYGEGSARLVVLNQDGSEGQELWTHKGDFGASEQATVTLP